MLKKLIPIIPIALSIFVVILVLSYAVFVKPEPVVPVQPMVENIVNNDVVNPATIPTTTSTTLPFAKDDDISELDTSDWKVYRNEEYGFEIKYPKDWKQNEKKEGIIISKMFENSIGRKEGGRFTIEVFSNLSSDSSLNSLNDWVKINDPISPENEKEIYSLKEIVIDNKKGLGRKKINTVWGFTSEERFIINEDKVFKLSITTNLSFPEGVKKQEEYDNALNKILSNFRFIIP